MLTALTLLAGLALLIIGAEMLVKGASRVAAGFGISPLVIGLTVVAFGTSSPEMAISVSSAWKGEADIAVGNVVGSNIFNVLFILGLSALITPLVVSKQLVKLDVPLMIGVSVLAFLLSMDGRIAFWEGAILFAGVIGYTILAIRMGKASGEAGDAVEGADRTWMNIGLIAVGLVLLVLGSQWLVSAAITIATAMGVSELVIGLTIVAAGTSMPEVATSITAAIRGQRDIAVGNVVGSNIFNILAVLGLFVLFKGLTFEVRGGDKIGGWPFKPWLIILGAVVIFGLALPRLGMIITLPLLIAISSFASGEFRWKEVLINVVVLTLGCWLVFIKGLNLTIPVWPTFLS
jgi:cation:H+ antiporter